MLLLVAPKEVQAQFSYATNDGTITLTVYGPGWRFAVTISNFVSVIGSRACLGCTNLTNVTITDGVSSISEGAFAWCDNLTPEFRTASPI